MSASHQLAATRLRLTTIGRKIIVVVGLPAIVALLLAMHLSQRRVRQMVRQDTAEAAAALVDLVATGFTLTESPSTEKVTSATPAHGAVAAALAADYGVRQEISHLRVIDRSGVVRWSRRGEEVGTRPTVSARLLSAPSQGLIDVEAGEYVRPVGGAQCMRCHAGQPFPLGVIHAVVARPRIEESLSGTFRGILLFVLGLFGALSLATGLLLHRFVTRPLGRLTEVMHRAERGDFLVRAPVETNDEIGSLAANFNSMVSKITAMKAAEIETSREIDLMQRELNLKAELERQHELVEKTNRALAHRVHEVTVLLDIAHSLNSTLALPEILKRVTEKVATTMGADRLSVMLLDEEHRELYVAASFGYPQDELEGYRLPLGDGACGLAAETGEPVYIADLHTDPRYRRSPHDPTTESSLLCVPMTYRDKLVGVLNFTRATQAAFSRNDVVLLELIGSQAAMAIVNARLYSETLEMTLLDPLTGLFNRRYLFSCLEAETAHAERLRTPLSIVMLDIDHFKTLNDTYGHLAGDATLREMAGLLRAGVRKTDTVARYGGEEFMVLLPKSSRAESLEVAEKLRRTIESATFVSGPRQPPRRATLSAGVATFPDDGQTAEELLDAVDCALYASKRAGRNRVTAYEQGMEMHHNKRQKIV